MAGLLHRWIAIASTWRRNILSGPATSSIAPSPLFFSLSSQPQPAKRNELVVWSGPVEACQGTYRCKLGTGNLELGRAWLSVNRKLRCTTTALSTPQLQGQSLPRAGGNVVRIALPRIGHPPAPATPKQLPPGPSPSRSRHLLSCSAICPTNIRPGPGHPRRLHLSPSSLSRSVCDLALSSLPCTRSPFLSSSPPEVLLYY
ncbi:hypothetical protein B0T26DRAFT_214441 [Lasiosphaeria miniovina]|uniref:Uncharacterized protein n=1 Tax=Lasiosphaeria miniovina TaxID=1954250 RepID=A0AA40E0D4_9PEZI|nr:uncharacterized protein B0T26DRAFT_214441 [Lasiosphaeria miniovina]KAK0722360.1 hypothetical protein B0T26DRAFT_214441 [Lasiosphaeria miniovina]